MNDISLKMSAGSEKPLHCATLNMITPYKYQRVCNCLEMEMSQPET